jgi:hypothetical protein
MTIVIPKRRKYNQEAHMATPKNVVVLLYVVSEKVLVNATEISLQSAQTFEIKPVYSRLVI